MRNTKSRAKKSYKVKAAPVPVIKSEMVKAIGKIAKKAVLPKAENKLACFYQSYNDGTTLTANRAGVNANRGWATQNQKITGVTDVLKLIPNVFQGSTDNQRIGQRITPVSLNLKGQVRVSLPRLNTRNRTDLKVVIYVLQAVAFKSYDALYNAAPTLLPNLLQTGENFTQAFIGEAFDKDRLVSDQYFKLIKKKTVSLRYAGLDQIGGGQIPGGTVVATANSHNYYAEFNMNLVKALPKHLSYPESADTANNQAEPINSSIFMAMGFVNQLEQAQPGEGIPAALTWIEQCYTTQMKFKDM